MNADLKTFCNKLEIKIVDIYSSGLTMQDAEKLAAEFLHAQMVVSEALTIADMDCRAKKSGVKGARAAVYLSEVQKTDKKPSDTLLGAIVDTNEVVGAMQDEYDMAEAEKLELERYYDIFLNCHIFTRGVAKGGFGG